MKRHALLCVLTITCILITAPLGHAQDGTELPAQVVLSVRVATGSAESLRTATAEDLPALLEQLEADGQLVSSCQLSLSALSENRCEVKFGQRVPVVVSRSMAPRSRAAEAARGGAPGGPPEGRGGGFPMATEVRYEMVGTSLSVTPRPVAGGLLVQVEFEQSYLAPTPAADPAAPEPSTDLPEIQTISLQTTVRFEGNKPVVVTRETRQQNGITLHTVVLMTADASGTLDQTQGAAGTSAVRPKLPSLGTTVWELAILCGCLVH